MPIKISQRPMQSIILSALIIIIVFFGGFFFIMIDFTLVSFFLYFFVLVIVMMVAVFWGIVKIENIQPHPPALATTTHRKKARASCWNCDTEVGDTDIYCLECGASLK